MKKIVFVLFLLSGVYKPLPAVEKDGIVMDFSISPLQMTWTNNEGTNYGAFSLCFGYRHHGHTLALEDNIGIYQIPNSNVFDSLMDINLIYGYTIEISPYWGFKPGLAIGYTGRRIYDGLIPNHYEGINIELRPEIYYQFYFSNYSTLDLGIFLKGNYRVYNEHGSEYGFSAGLKIIYTYDIKSYVDDFKRWIKKANEVNTLLMQVDDFIGK